MTNKRSVAEIRGDSPPRVQMAERVAEQTITLTRTLRGPQAARQSRLIAAARELASSGGYAAVTMHEVADRAGVSRATVYRYFASKDHLLTAVSADWARDITASFDDHPPAGRTSTARVRSLLDRVIEATAQDLQLAAATVQAATSPDPAAYSALDGLAAIIIGHLDAAIGDEIPQAARVDIETVLAHVLFSALVALTIRGQTVEHVQEYLHVAARVTLADR